MNDNPSMFGLKLGTKLMLLIGAALVSLVIIGAVAVIGLNRIAEDSRKLNEEGLAELTFIGELQLSIERMSSYVANAPKETDQRILEAGREQFQVIAGQLQSEIVSMQDAAAQNESDHAEELGDILDALKRYIEHSNHVFQMSGDGDWYGADKMMTEETIPAKRNLDALAAEYISGVKRESQSFIARMKAEIGRMTNMALAAAIGLIIAVGGGGLYIVTTSMRAINAIAGVTGRLAAGDMDVRIPGGERTDEIGEMARSLEQVRAVGLRAARAQSSLDDASSAMTIVDLDGSIIFSNKAMTALAEHLADDISGELPGFATPSLVGEAFDRLHHVDAMKAGALAESDAQIVARMVAAGHTIEMTASPVFNDEGARLGTVVEWQDMSGQVAVEREIASIVHAAGDGDFSQRLAEADKSGFMAELANGINELLDVVDHGLDQVVKIMSALAEGDLTKRMRGEHKGAFALLKQDADRMGQQMEEMVGRIAGVSGIVKTATDEISAGIADLSMRTEHQASSLEETTASMEELSATVRQNADNAQEANQVASAAREAAVSGGDVVNRAVTAMGGIEDSAKQITEIVGLIQEIAFQTNLLALNASVEAARAGEAGRGFAVVANEVRALAQRAAAASKDIKELITNSDERVQEGAKLVGEAGDALGEIVTSVKKVADYVSDIAAASREQTSGLDQVSGAISGMDEMTQQNASLVEETTGALNSALSQVDELQAAVGIFKTDRRKSVGRTPDSGDTVAAAARLHETAKRMAAAGKMPGSRSTAVSQGANPADDEGWDEF